MSDQKHFFCKGFLNLNFMATWCINSEKIFGKYDFPYHFKKKIVLYKRIGYNIDVLRQTIKVNNFDYLFDCTTVCRASD